jgi:hypothetical protein
VFFLRRDSEVDTLARYVDAVVAGGALDAGRIDSRFGGLVRALRAELRRHEPDPAFAANLRLRLIAAADQRAPAPVPIALWRRPRFIIGAAGVFSAAAILAYVARSRMQAARAA